MPLRDKDFGGVALPVFGPQQGIVDPRRLAADQSNRDRERMQMQQALALAQMRQASSLQNQRLSARERVQGTPESRAQALLGVQGGTQRDVQSDQLINQQLVQRLVNQGQLDVTDRSQVGETRRTGMRQGGLSEREQLRQSGATERTELTTEPSRARASIDTRRFEAGELPQLQFRGDIINQLREGAVGGEGINSVLNDPDFSRQAVGSLLGFQPNDPNAAQVQALQQLIPLAQGDPAVMAALIPALMQAQGVGSEVAQPLVERAEREQQDIEQAEAGNDRLVQRVEQDPLLSPMLDTARTPEERERLIQALLAERIQGVTPENLSGIVEGVGELTDETSLSAGESIASALFPPAAVFNAVQNSSAVTGASREQVTGLEQKAERFLRDAAFKSPQEAVRALETINAAIDDNEGFGGSAEAQQLKLKLQVLTQELLQQSQPRAAAGARRAGR